MRSVRDAVGLVVGLALLGVSASPFFAKTVTPVQKSGDSGATSMVAGQGAHMDHKSQHGGTFFMCLDNKHHLEGVLFPPGAFRVYLYDDHTRPLKADEIKAASGTVQVGDSEDAPKISLGLGKKKETLEASLGETVKFPVTLTLLLRLPGEPPDAKPELFNFSFTQFTDEHSAGSCSPMKNMPTMGC